MYEQYLTYFYTYILPPIVALVTGVISGYILRAKKWWGEKTIDQQKDALKDAVTCLLDWKLSPSEIGMLIDEHVYNHVPPEQSEKEPVEDE